MTTITRSNCFERGERASTRAHSLSTINTIITLHYQTHNSPFHASTCKSNASTFNFLLEAIFKDLHRDEIAAKFMKAGTQDPISHANRYQDLGSLLTYRLPSHALVTQVSLFCNALTFDVRLNKAIPQPSRGPTILSPAGSAVKPTTNTATYTAPAKRSSSLAKQLPNSSIFPFPLPASASKTAYTFHY